MKTYIKFLGKTFLNSFFYVLLIIMSLIFILNLLSELEFFKDIQVNNFLPIYLSLLNAPTLIFELFPFIFLVSTQLFFITLFNNNELGIFKYSGLKNSRIILILSTISFVLGLLIITIFYNFSSNLKNFYLNLKTNYTSDGKYLAVINKNGLWIKDIVNENTILINASKIEKNFIIDAYISELRALDQEVNDLIQSVPSDNRKMITTHEALGYLEARYGIEIVGTVIPSFSTEEGVAPKDLTGVIEKIKEHDMKIMFLESESPSKGAEVVAQETGVRLVSGLWVETLRSADESYADFLRSNVNIIVDNLKQ